MSTDRKTKTTTANNTNNNKKRTRRHLAATRGTHKKKTGAHLLHDGHGSGARQCRVERVVKEVGDGSVEQETERRHSCQTLVRELVLGGPLLRKEVPDGEPY